MKNNDSIYIGSTDARKRDAGYRIQFSCANCTSCHRKMKQGKLAARCTLHHFTVNIDKGICNAFIPFTNPRG